MYNIEQGGVGRRVSVNCTTKRSQKKEGRSAKRLIIRGGVPQQLAFPPDDILPPIFVSDAISEMNRFVFYTIFVNVEQVSPVC